MALNMAVRQRGEGIGRSVGLCGGLLLALCVLVPQPGCQRPSDYRMNADTVAGDIISEKQHEAFNRTEPFSIERPSDILRRRLLLDQDLPYTDAASLGADQLDLIAHWPEPNYSLWGGKVGSQREVE